MEVRLKVRFRDRTNMQIGRMTETYTIDGTMISVTFEHPERPWEDIIVEITPTLDKGESCSENSNPGPQTSSYGQASSAQQADSDCSDQLSHTTKE